MNAYDWLVSRRGRPVQMVRTRDVFPLPETWRFVVSQDEPLRTAAGEWALMIRRDMILRFGADESGQATGNGAECSHVTAAGWVYRCVFADDVEQCE